MKFNKIIIISDMLTGYEIAKFNLKDYLDFETVLGENITRFARLKYQPDSYEMIEKLLFPKARVQPVILKELTKDTIVILSIRDNHFLINTTFSTEDFSREVVYDTNKNLLNYIFFNFKKPDFTIKPRIAKDSLGVLKYFGENLDDNLIRETILSFMHLPKAPNESIKRLRVERADNSIIYDDETIVIRYNGGKAIRILNEAPVRDILFLIQNKISTSNVAELWGKLRNRTYEDNSIATNNFQKSRSRLLKDLRFKENKNSIPLGQRFSEFVDKFININSGDCTITYEAPEEIRWELDLPDNLHD